MSIKSDFWNERYSATEYVYGEEPNSYLKKHYHPFLLGVFCL